MQLVHSDDESWRTTDERLVLLNPPLLWPSLRHDLLAGDPWLPDGFDPTGATPILLELPIFAITPPLDSGQWHHSVVTTDIPTPAVAYEPVSGEVSAVALNKVLVEFSPLELVRWDEVETSRDEIVFWRGAYVEHDGAKFKLWLINQTFPTGRLRISGAFPFLYDSKSRQLVIEGKKDHLPLRPPAKTLLSVLTLLRELSDKPIACPFPSHGLDDNVFVVRVQGRTARLVKTRAARGHDDLYLLRNATRDEPFDATGHDGGVLLIRSTKGWPALHLDEIRMALPNDQVDNPSGV